MNFNEEVNRKNTGSVKWDLMKEFEKPEDVLPLWVADMDFKSPIGVIDALAKRVGHGVFGYTHPTDSYYDSVISWMKRRHNLDIKKEWIVVTPGVVPAINFYIQEFTEINDCILIQQPVYNPFIDSILKNERTLVNSPLVLKDNHYEIDFADFENKIIENHVKLFILCNPHNPVGRVWSEDELRQMGDICIKHNVFVIVDEIHHDLVFKNKKHISFASLSESFLHNSMTCTAPSKTFNIASLKIANIIIENKDILNRINLYLEKLDIKTPNLFGIVACEAAYNTGEEWLDHLLDYLEENKRYVIKFFQDKFPMINVIDSEGTYLLWLDFRQLGLSDSELEKFFIESAKLWLNDGYRYGEEGSGFQRMNIACPRSTLIKALNQLEESLK